jgi:hypothetical protein
MSKPDERDECSQCGKFALLYSGFCEACEYDPATFEGPAMVTAGAQFVDANCEGCGRMHGRLGGLCLTCETEVLDSYERARRT